MEREVHAVTKWGLLHECKDGLMLENQSVLSAMLKISRKSRSRVS